MISIKKLEKSYGKNKVLKGLNLELDEGKVYGIVGENGSGKTTLFRCIAGFEKYQGEIISELNPIKNHIGFLPTNPEFLSRITAWEYLKLICVARGIKTEYFEEQNIFDLPLDRYAEHFSTGMKKKLALTGILLQKNQYYILDEPFSGVDIHSNILINAIIQKLKSANKIVLISSHIFSTLSSNCDFIYHLKSGNIQDPIPPKDYPKLEQEMESLILGDRLKKLNIE